MPTPQQELIERYKDLIRKDNNKEELYKWELVQKFQNLWSERRDILQVFQEIDFSNLLYHTNEDMVKNIQDHPFKEEVAACIDELFNEERELSQRIQDFYTKTGEISERRRAHYENANQRIGERQDERCMSVYLTCRYPEIYSIYKASFYKKYCERLGIQARRSATEKYIHYLEHIDDLSQNYISKDQ